jgi:hypothetical protein
MWLVTDCRFELVDRVVDVFPLDDVPADALSSLERAVAKAPVGVLVLATFGALVHPATHSEYEAFAAA